MKAICFKFPGQSLYLGNCLRRWSENASWRAIFWRRDGNFPAIFSCWPIPGGVCLGAHPLSNPIASENRSVRKSQRQRVAGPKKGFQAHPLSKPCVQTL